MDILTQIALEAEETSESTPFSSTFAVSSEYATVSST